MITLTTDTITGPLGTATRAALAKGLACLAQWQLRMPGAHPFWHSYLLSIVHLRPIAGSPPAVLRYPEAAYEVSLYALDPQSPHAILTPANIVEQVHGLSDDQIPALGRLVAQALLSGAILAEPQGIWGALDLNRRTLDVLLAQARGGES